MGTLPVPTGPKRIVVATLGEPLALNANVGTGGISVPGAGTIISMLNGTLAAVDSSGNLQPQLAEAVPSLENGLWKLLPDGRMETTWRIRPGARWHNGVPLTAADLVFTTRVMQDRELPAFREPAYHLVESVEAIDEQSVVIRWRSPYIDADAMFTGSRAALLPRDLLERAYLENKAGFMELPFWTDEFVGSGPYTVQEWFRGSHMVLTAYDGYVLGRPKIDQIEVKFIPDPNTLVANLVAGSVELTLGRSLSLEQAIEVASHWRGGHVDLPLTSWIVLHPQLLTPNPAVIRELEFRRAMLQAIDRQAMVDTLQDGRPPVAHSFIAPDQPEYGAIESRAVRYAYDPRLAVQRIEGLGFQRAADGTWRGPTGEPLGVELRASTVDINQKSMFAVADYWRRVGVPTETVTVSPQRLRDQEYVATFPGFQLLRGANPRAIRNLHSSRRALPENNFATTGNTSRYAHPDLDALIDRYLVTISRPERTEVLAHVVNHVTDQVIMLGLFFNTDPVLIADRLVNVTTGSQDSPTWNAHLWDVRTP